MIVLIVPVIKNNVHGMVDLVVQALYDKRKVCKILNGLAFTIDVQIYMVCA